MSRMFKLLGDRPIKTWNPFVGCLFGCRYCWARRMAKRSRCTECANFRPHLHPERLGKAPKSGIVFVSDMGDISFAGAEGLRAIIEAATAAQEGGAVLFFETKNPGIYHAGFWGTLAPGRTILSTTIETNRPVAGVTLAPPPRARYDAMRALAWPRKHISVEPVMDFDLDILFAWISGVEPEVVSIGYDNYGNGLPEPPLEKTIRLIEMLEASGIRVEKKTLRKPSVGGGRA